MKKYDFDQEQYRREIDTQLSLDNDKKEQLAEELRENAAKAAPMTKHGLQRGSSDVDSKPYIPEAPDDQDAVRRPRRLWRWGGAAAAAVVVVLSALTLPNFLSQKPGAANAGASDIQTDPAAFAQGETSAAVSTGESAPGTAAETTPAAAATTREKEAAHSSEAHSAGENPTAAVTSGVQKVPAITVRTEKEAYPVGTEGVQLIVRDDNNAGCWWGLDYSLAIRQGDDWTALPFKKDVGIPAIAQGMQPNPDADYVETVTYIDFKNYLEDPALAPGHYRVSKEISGAVYYAEFSIEDDG